MSIFDDDGDDQLVVDVSVFEAFALCCHLGGAPTLANLPFCQY